MALNFPLNPTVGQQYTYPPFIYEWDGDKWVTITSPTSAADELREDLAADTGASIVGTSTGQTVQYELDNHTHTAAEVGALAVGGTAVAASKLAAARSIALTGDATGSVLFDGSSNVSITTTVVDDLHNHTIANVDNLQTALDGKVNLTGGTMNGNLINSSDFIQTGQRAFRSVGDGTGVGTFWHHDNNQNFYLMLTNRGDSYGSWNSLRPLHVNMDTGVVTIQYPRSSSTQQSEPDSLIRKDWADGQYVAKHDLLSVIAQDWDTLTTTGNYSIQAANSTTGTPNAPTLTSLYGTLLVNNANLFMSQLYIPDEGSSRMAYRGKYSGGGWTAWQYPYTTARPPTTSEVGAFPMTGGTLNGRITAKGVGNLYTQLAYEAMGDGSGVLPGYGFHQPGAYEGTLMMTDSANFMLRNASNSAFSNFHCNVVYTADVYVGSDRRLKSDFSPLENALDKVCVLEGQTYIKNDKREAGIIAQDLQKVLPEAVHENDQGYLSISPAGVNALVIEAIKELNKENKHLKSIIEYLELEIAEMKQNIRGRQWH